MEFEGKKAVVTGAARGIGRGISRLLNSKGVQVAVVDVEIETALETAEEMTESGVAASAYACDVSSYEDAASTGEKILADLGSVDFLVNNAGVVRDKLLLRMSPEDWERVIAVNLTGAFNFCKVFASHMLKRKSGRIVNIASVIGMIGNAGQANYAASKAGIIGLTKSLAKEFAPRGVTVNAVAPGFIETQMTSGLSKEIREKMINSIPLGRFGHDQDVANVVLFLLSDAAGYVTGQVLNCDGGMVMNG